MPKYERNFKIKTLPDNFKDWEKSILKEWIVNNNSVILRFRLYDDNRCYMDMKKDGDKDSHEYGVKCKYDDIKFLIGDLPYVEKDRYKQRMDNYLFTIDIFDDGVKIFEIESKNKKIVDNFIPFDWLGKEIKN